MPRNVPIARTPEATPYRSLRMRSGTIAICAVPSAFRASITSTQKIPSTHRFGDPDSNTMSTAARAALMTIHGARRPMRLRVRSLNAPTSGWMMIAPTEDAVITIARFPTLLTGSRRCTWSGMKITMNAA